MRVAVNMMKQLITTNSLWATPVMFIENSGDEVEKYNKELESIVVGGCKTQGGALRELRLHDLHENDSPAVAWLIEQVKQASALFCNFPNTEGIQVELRGVVLYKGYHINTHTEARESDIGIAYWTGGSSDEFGSEINKNGDGISAPTFALEDPSRHISDLRLPMEHRHSVDVCPRAGLMAVFPAHIPHNVHPYMGDKPFVHIVAQVRMPWDKQYFRGDV